MAHKRKTVTDLDQRVIERKKKYVRYQEGAELYSMGVNTLRKNTTKVYNIKAYLLAVLFNAGTTMSNYYRAEVNHDMPQFAG